MKRLADQAGFESYVREHTRCLGRAVHEFRTERGLSHSEVAKRAEVSVRWLKKLETNELHTNYSIGKLDQITRALGLDLSDLYQRAGEMAGPPPWLNCEGGGNER